MMRGPLLNTLLGKRVIRRHRFKILLFALVVFVLVLWTQHYSLSAQQQYNIVGPPPYENSIDTLKSEKRVKQQVGNIDISVVVLAKSKHIVHTRNCMRALQRHLPTSIAIEILVVDALPYDFHRRKALAVSLTPILLDNPTHTTTTTPLHVPLSPPLLFLNESRKSYPNNEQLSAATNYGAQISRGKYILFITDNTEILSGTLEAIYEEFESAPSDIGVMGNMLIAADQTIVQAGIEFIMSRKNRYSETVNQPYTNKRYAGYSVTDSRAIVKADVLAVTTEFMITRRDLFQSMGGVNETFGDEFSCIDFCMRARANGKRVVYTPRSVAVNFEEGDEEKEDAYTFMHTEDTPHKVFAQRWGRIVEASIQENYILKNLTLRWSMECGAGQTLGFTTEALYFILGLKSKIDVKIELSDANKCQGELRRAGMARSVQRAVIKMSNKVVPAGQSSVLVVHRDPGRYSAFIGQCDDPISYIVGRSMYETDRIPDDWVKPCMENVAEIWVPSQFNIETFNKSGVAAEKLFKVPEPIDIFTYRPENIDPLVLPNRKGFAFLSVMKWEKRKGWDVLLRAYFEEFSAKDDVSLFLRAHLDSGNLAEFQNFIKNTTEDLKQRNPKKTFPQSPQIVDNLLPYLGMRSLYAAVDCVVQPSRGEGWGLPIIEAMAMGIPTIATNWSGNTEFMRKDNSFLLDVHGFTNATKQGHLWAEPSLPHLKSLMRRVISNRAEAQQVGQAAKYFVEQNFSQEKIANLVIENLRRIQVKIEETARAAAAAPPIQPATERETTPTTPVVRTKSQMKINP